MTSFYDLSIIINRDNRSDSEHNLLLTTDIRRQMNDVKIDRILENLLYILPVLHKKILRMDLGGVAGNLNRPHFAIMGILHENSTRVTELAKILAVTKPQMTFLVDQLVKMEVVERHPDASDRRVINLVLSEKGRVLLEEMKRRVKEYVRLRLAGLTDDELTAMSSALETLRIVVAEL